ncbi:hypothetical protein H6G80_06675 [Nostoc sp. FACHB-87]|uniref:hypothetical protein n=1 Tax=Nostocaceae TaxID=1162 RepID=UPI0016864B9A|nr:MULTISPECIES: hypothetical protein [Nostocaceae]MBD2453759.1 hypothetical protein [Nostoc sp. FACHB-87]MBD2475285.1 hypothetical protein [Anabaena sp. FACHB-83]
MYSVSEGVCADKGEVWSYITVPSVLMAIAPLLGLVLMVRVRSPDLVGWVERSGTQQMPLRKPQNFQLPKYLNSNGKIYAAIFYLLQYLLKI